MAGACFWDTVFDVISLGFSVVDVVKNPDDPWAWVGLGADIVSLVVPFATGGGTIVRAATKVDDVVDVVKGSKKVVNAVETETDVAKAIDKASDATKLHRPYIRKSTREAVEAAAKRAPDGKFLDANTGKVITGKYDLGHASGKEFWRQRDMAMSKGLEQKKFNDYMNNPTFYRIEDPILNRSHKFEMPKG
jgi:hypothetical protein